MGMEDLLAAFGKYSDAGDKTTSGDRSRGKKDWRHYQLVIDPDELAMIRILDYAFYRRGFHWPWNSRPQECSCDKPGFDGRCVYCYWFKIFADHETKIFFEERDQGKKYDKRWNKLKLEQSYTVQVVDFRFWHKLPTEDGGFELQRCSDDDVDPVRPLCELCEDADAEVAQRHAGILKRWELDDKDKNFDRLMKANNDLQRICLGVTSKGEICGKKCGPERLACATCDVDLDPPKKVQRMSDPQIIAARRSTYTCENGHEGIPQLFSVCNNRDEHECVRGHIWAKNLLVKNEGDWVEKKKGGMRATQSFKIGIEGQTATLEEELDAFGVPDSERERIEAGIDFDATYAPERFAAKTQSGRQLEVKRRSDYDDVEDYVQAVLASQAARIEPHIQHLLEDGESVVPAAYRRAPPSSPPGGRPRIRR